MRVTSFWLQEHLYFAASNVNLESGIAPYSLDQGRYQPLVKPFREIAANQANHLKACFSARQSHSGTDYLPDIPTG